MTIQQRVAANIRERARAKGLSLNKLADFAGVSPRQLYSFLGGKHDVTLGWLARIADALDVDVLDLTVPPSD